MRRLTFVIPVVFVFILGTIGLAFAATQDGTPADEEDRLPDATYEVIAGPALPESDDATPVPGEIVLQMFRTVIPFDGFVPEHEHPGPSLWLIESGILEFTPVEGEIWAFCADGCELQDGGASPTGLQQLTLGETILLEPGDWVQQYDTASHAAHNPSDEPAVMIVVGEQEPTFGVLRSCHGAC